MMHPSGVLKPPLLLLGWRFPMKIFFALMLSLVAGFIVYQWISLTSLDGMGYSDQHPWAQQASREVEVGMPEPKPALIVEPAPMTEPPREVEVVPVPGSSVPAVPMASRPPAKPGPVPQPMPEAPAPPRPPEPPRVARSRFTPPVFPSVKELTHNWTAVPAGFFTKPRQITVKKDLVIRMEMEKASASTTLKAGTSIFATAQQGPNLVVRATANSAMHGLAAMDDTDFKAVFAAAYEEVKARQTERARREHEHRLAAAERARSAPHAASQEGGGRPVREASGAYPLLLESMRSGQVTEVRPGSIKRWGDAAEETISGITYWVVPVTFETQTLFGNFETEVQALVKNGRVDKWIYTGSGEVVP